MLGHNGAGKTTTVNLLLNFVQPTSGRIEIGGQNLHQNPAQVLKQVAYIPELVMLYPELNALDNLGYFSRLAGKDYSRSELESHLQRAGLPAEAFKRPVGRYSKGMRQKVGIAIALAKKASLLVLDEPTSGLDPQASYEFSQLLQDLAASGVAIFMVTHDLFRVRELRAQVGILKLGKLQRLLDSETLSHQELESLYLQVAH
jgi:ABC-2 type transport system ATP-binding protein